MKSLLLAGHTMNVYTGYQHVCRMYVNTLTWDWASLCTYSTLIGVDIIINERSLYSIETVWGTHLLVYVRVHSCAYVLCFVCV